ncbi:hypothetical protein TNCV_1033861 [Trichonephila clavipes]|nr:hypothetical protein TNCV_1033861 [Trichonephila clavipes]
MNDVPYALGSNPAGGGMSVCEYLVPVSTGDSKQPPSHESFCVVCGSEERKDVPATTSRLFFLKIRGAKLCSHLQGVQSYG